MEVIEKFLRARQNMTVGPLLIYMLNAPGRKISRRLDIRAVEKADSLMDRFTLIYKRNAWGSKESVSGSGSTLAMTESIREKLPILFKEFSIGSIFDAPCGDFHWMQLVDLKGISYIGGEIVQPLVNLLNKKFSSRDLVFLQFDITQSVFPKSDLVLNRDCLFHLSYQDILLTLENFLESGSKYFLSTSYDDDKRFLNSDIRSGGFRPIDLFSQPFSFPRDFLFQISENGEGTLPPRSLYLWDREQVTIAQFNLENFISG